MATGEGEVIFRVSLLLIYTLLFCFACLVSARLVMEKRPRHRLYSRAFILRLFYFFSCTVFLLRMVRYLLFPIQDDNDRQPAQVALTNGATILFYCAYLLVNIFWYEQYILSKYLLVDIQRMRMLISRGRVGFVVGVVCILLLFIVYVIVLVFSPVNEKLVRLFAGVIILLSSLIIALLFPFTGRRLLRELSKSMFITPERLKLLRKIGVLTVVCSITFLLRAVYSLLELSVEYVDGGHPWTEFAYFLVVEIVPSSLMFSVLRPALGKRKFWVSKAGPAPQGIAPAVSSDVEKFDDMSTPLSGSEYSAVTKD
eukprot:TRINITY_DN2523_c0_g1_i7.p1 TRINITY_DN2523_c0_g1~~TRINITY_DN2523_c0_g1_i7.p1  ORF type:complete len:312 (+),score=49.93 TRINITY_DN2523_c0_g1_i7:603-1538(+)